VGVSILLEVARPSRFIHWVVCVETAWDMGDAVSKPRIGCLGFVLLWLFGVPIPALILIWLLFGHH
jgi:hypothetical protein